MVVLQRDYLGLDILDADFAIVRLGLRYKISAQSKDPKPSRASSD